MVSDPEGLTPLRRYAGFTTSTVPLVPVTVTLVPAGVSGPSADQRVSPTRTLPRPMLDCLLHHHGAADVLLAAHVEVGLVAERHVGAHEALDPENRRHREGHEDQHLPRPGHTHGEAKDADDDRGEAERRGSARRG